ncbi:MAG: polysaccharide biosynthesis tyrosine autokinase [Pseudomonadota bacterium]
MYSSNNQNVTSSVSEEEINFKDVFAILGRYKVSIIAITVFTLFLAVINAYFSMTVYQANLTMKIQPESQNGSAASDILADALGGQKVNIENEMVILRSKLVVQKALESVPMEIRYYTKKQFKMQELYKDTPFTVNCKSLSELLTKYKFQLHPVDATHFRLTIEPSMAMKLLGMLSGEELIYISQRYPYNTPIRHPLFSMSVTQNSIIANQDYFFTIIPNDQMIDMVQSSLNISVTSDKSSVLLLTYQDNIPQRAEDMLNALAHAYQLQNNEMKSAGAKKTLSFIDKQLEAINQSLQNSASNVKDYKTSHTVTVDLKDKAVMAAQKLNELEKQRYELDMQEGVYTDLLRYVQSNSSVTGIDTGSISLLGSPLLPLIEKLQEAGTLRSTLMVDYTNEHPSVIKVNQQINALRANLRASIESNLRGIHQRKMTLNTIIQKNNQLLMEIPENEKQLSKLMNGLMVNQKVYEYLLQKRAETTILESSTVSGDWIVDRAFVEKTPVKPQPALIILIGIILGLMIGITQALARNALSGTIETISDIEKRTALPVFAILPYFQNKKSLYQDALRVLLTKLVYSDELKKPKILTLTSSVLGEGRATTGIELGRVMAQSGKKVIIVDMDMRHPSIHQKLQIKNDKGISTFLSGRCELTEVVYFTDQINMNVICSGSAVDSPYDLIMSDHFKVLLEYLKETYDYIILVAPPAGLVADALVLMRLSDLNLILFKAKYSKKDFVTAIDRFVKEHQLDNVGIILNSLELKKIRRWL